MPEDGSLDDLTAWVAGARAAEAAGERARARWLRRQAEDEASWDGTLLDLAERGTSVSVRTVAGRVLTGSLALVGRDVCAVRAGGGAVTFVPLDAIDVVSAATGATLPATGRRRCRGDVTLADVLGRLCDDETPVTVRLRTGGDPLAGVVLALGADVVTLGPDAAPGGARRTVYARVRSISEISLRESG